MKKINSSGFVMAETLIVTVFLTVIFAMLYSSFLPLAGEYEKRENYDNIDGKYAVFWIKRMIEDTSFEIPSDKANNIKDNGYIRFQCSYIIDDEEKRNLCINLVKTFEVEGCNNRGDDCDIFITKYRLKNINDGSRTWFKDAIDIKKKRYNENCEGTSCEEQYIQECQANEANANRGLEYCTNKANKSIFSTAFKEYVFYLPDYAATSLNYANYRVIATFHNRKDNNNYYSFATIEVSR